jgi:ribose 1,5-bisphosphate isomerase
MGLLPLFFPFTMKLMNPAQDVHTDIVSLKIQGATNVALAMLDTLTLTVRNAPDTPVTTLKEIAESLAYARPTEPLAQNAVRSIFADSPKNAAAMLGKIATYTTYIKDAKKKIAAHGASLMQDGKTYLTHCHASTVTNAFLAAHAEGKKLSVIATETRPLFQGRLTVRELIDGGIDPVTLIVDSAAASALADPKRDIAAVFIGADLLTDTGFVNKIGSLAIVLAARAKSIPVYCFSTLLKYDPRPFDDSLIETRNPSEIWQDPPEKLSIFAPAFDFTPYASDISVITEAGLLRGEEVAESARMNYPFISL